MGDAGVFLRHSRRGREVRPTPAPLGWGIVGGAITLYDGSKRPVEEEVIQGGVVAGARFRIPPEPGAAAWWERSPGSPTIRVVHRFSLLSFQPGRASVLSPSS